MSLAGKSRTVSIALAVQISLRNIISLTGCSISLLLGVRTIGVCATKDMPVVFTEKVKLQGLPPNLSEWGLVDPTSSVGRLNYRPGKRTTLFYKIGCPDNLAVGIYGRLDPKGVFPTTVTNVDPTAKQSQCLHPRVRRVICGFLYI